MLRFPRHSIPFLSGENPIGSPVRKIWGTSERARKLVSQAVAAVTLIRPASCERCGARPQRADRHGLDAHHISSSRPLDVTWLCASCHRLAHPRRPPTSPAEAELRINPARSDRLIATLTGVEHHSVSRARQRLEQTGDIPPIPVRARVPRYPNGPRALGRAQQAVLQLGPDATTRQVMDASGVGAHSAWYARTHPRAARQHPVADAAAATDTLSVVRTAPRTRPPRPSRFTVGSAPPAGYYAPPDEIESWCCTQEYVNGGWQHERSCVMRLAAR